ncbi:MAG: hypothetical protein ABIH83_03235, partial [Candidatus Micrarchaeota archaeon]
MNIIQILIMGIRIYTSKFGLYILAGLLLALSIIVSMGFGIVFIIIDGLIALFMGPGGAWLYNPISAAAVLLSTLCAILTTSYLFFPSIGAFMHTCAKIGSGRKDVSLMTHFDYMKENMNDFWFIGIIQQAIAGVPALVVLIVAILLGGISHLIVWAGVAVSALVWMVCQFPFWLAFPAKIVKKRGALGSLRNSLKANLKAPVGSIAMLLIIYILIILPAISLVLYPIYFFLMLAPFASIVLLAFYEASEG